MIEDAGAVPAISTRKGNSMDVREWVQYGVDRGYANTYCYLHDSSPMTDKEEEEYVVEGGDPCIPTLRVWLEGEREALSGTDHHTEQLSLL